MNALILAAGLGTRLKPWTERHPKALVPVGGVPMLERVIVRLIDSGFDNIVVNVHHFSGQIVEFIDKRDFGVKIKISDESGSLLDTGGGIVKASPLFGNDSPILVHNVDILSDADLGALMTSAFSDKDSDSILLVSDRESTRRLLFDSEMTLLGWYDTKSGAFRPENLRKENDTLDYAFSGIYVMKHNGVEEMRRLMGDGAFPVMDYFLNTKRCCRIRGEVAKKLEIIDIGKPETLLRARMMNQKFR